MRTIRATTITGALLWLFAATAVFAAGPPVSGSLLPAGLVMADTCPPGQGAPVGQMASASGQVVIVRAGTTQACLAEADHALYENDLLVTREGARAVLNLKDGSRVSLAETTRLVIDRAVYDPDAGTRESLLGMSLGKARFWVRKIAGAKRSSFRVKTETAVAGVRGSDFVVRAAAGPVTEVVALGNTRLEVFSLAAPDRVVVLSDYQRTVVIAGELPNAPEVVAPEEIERLKRQFPDPGVAGASMGGAVPAGLSGAAGVDSSIGGGSKIETVTPGRGGAVIRGSVINKAAGVGAVNAAAGQNAAAGMGTVRIENSQVKGSIVNRSDVGTVVNSAVGPGSEANVGTIKVE
jgi:hypothetical protein